MIFRIALLICAAVAFASGQSRTEPAPIIDSNVRCLLGGSNGLKWVSEDEAAALLTGGEMYRLIRYSGQIGRVKGGQPDRAGGTCEGTISVSLTPVPDHSKPFLALGGDWNLSPRSVVDIIGVRERYGKLYQPFLDRSGMKGQANVRQLYRVDLDNDGTDEVVAVLRNFSIKGNDAPASGQRYSAIAVRRVVNNSVETVPIAVDIETDRKGPREHNIAFILDLNNDGGLEIVVYGRSRQGPFTDVYALEDGNFKKVLSCSCGG